MKYLFFMSAIELALMGSGQAISYKGISLRMLLFVILVPYSIFKSKLSDTIIRNFIICLGIFIGGICIGALNNASTAYILNDIKPLLFIFYLIPLNYFLEDNENQESVIKIIKVSALILAILYLIYVVLVLFIPIIKLIPLFLESHNEVFFRPNGLFFYKGFLTIMVGFIFYVYSNSRYKYAVSIILLSAMILTLTRGLLAALLCTFIGIFIIDTLMKKKISKTKLILTPLVFLVILFGISFALSLYGDKSASDAIRFQIVDQVMENMTALSLIIGHGLGIGVDVRELHMEIAFLEILHKQGIIGLSFWMYLFIQSFLYYRNSKLVRLKAKPFFLIILSIYLISFTNPFVNNPIGLYPLLLSFICLKKLDAENISMHTNL